MKFGYQIAVVVLGLALFRPSFAEEVTGAATLTEKLSQLYKPAGLGRAGSDASGLKLLSVRLPGIVAVPAADAASYLEACASVYRGGAIRQSPNAFCSQKANDSQRKLKVAESVYVTSIVVAPVLDKISLYLVACGTCTADSQKAPLRSLLVVEFSKGYLAKAGVEGAVRIIDQVLKNEASAPPDGAPLPVDESSTPASPAAASPPVAEAPTAPTSPAPTVPGEAAAQPAQEAPILKKGDAREVVEKVLGSPLLVFDLGTKLVHIYPQFKVFYIDGKLDDVQ
jgi:hypothetical protein